MIRSSHITFAYVYFTSSVVNHILLDTEAYVVPSYSLYTLLTYFTSAPCVLGNISVVNHILLDTEAAPCVLGLINRLWAPPNLIFDLLYRGVVKDISTTQKHFIFRTKLGTVCERDSAFRTLTTRTLSIFIFAHTFNFIRF